jgi:hypothetical protein
VTKVSTVMLVSKACSFISFCHKAVTPAASAAFIGGLPNSPLFPLTPSFSAPCPDRNSGALLDLGG